MTFFLPGLIWFYYDYKDTLCDSPIDDDLSLMVTFYLAISIIMFIFAINTCIEGCRCYHAINIGLYLLFKLGIGITMLVYIQKDYYGNWENNTCSSLKPLTIFWLVWNYILICITFILSCIFFIFPILDECC